MISGRERVRKVEVITQVLSANQATAGENRALLKKHHVLGVNLMASPGAGKTSLILQTAQTWAGRYRLGVIEGDVASRIDADKVASRDIPVVQITTGGECHLDALTVQRALKTLPLHEIDILFIENVGNLICPVEFQLGEKVRVVVASVPEGDDKPYKYPGIFTAVNAVVLNKIDLLPYVDFGIDAMRQGVSSLNPEAPLFEVSCRTGEGVEGWAEWLGSLARRQ